ncbi:MAG: VWA domain-containing protein [candidate division WOR-3 bacterium]
MRFLAPGFFLLLPLTLIPILIHLLSRVRLRQIPFPSIILFQNVERATFSWLRLKEILLLILRTLLLLLFVLGLSRPYLLAPALPVIKTGDLLIILDDSYSMGYGDRWQNARHLTERLIRTSARPRLLLTSQPDTILTGRRALLALIDTIKPSATASTLSPALNRAFSFIHAAPMPILLLTDLQRRALPDTGISRPPTLFRIVNFGTGDFENCGVTRAELIDRVIKAEVSNYGKTAISRTIRLSVEGLQPSAGGPIQEEQIVNLPPRSTTTITFNTRIEQPGCWTGTVTISPDLLPIDDTHHFVLFLPNRLLVLLVTSEAVPGRYISLALSADTTAPFALTEIKVEQFRRTDIARYPLIIITDAAELKDADVERLQFYLNSGGCALLISGTPVAEGHPLNRLFSTLGISRPAGFLTIADFDTTHPVFSTFRPADFATARFFSHTRVKGGRALARLSDGDPLIIAYPEQNLIVWTFAPIPEATDLIYKAPFAPLLHRTLLYLAQLPFKTEYTVGDSVIFIVNSTKPVLIATPTGERSITPELKRDQALPQAIVRITDTRIPGIYRLVDEESSTRDRNSPRLSAVAVNLEPLEGDLKIADVSILQKRGISVQSDATGAGTDLTDLCFYLAAFALALEMVILALERSQKRMPVRR